jgi:hypothetical protein
VGLRGSRYPDDARLPLQASGALKRQLGSR